MKSAKQKERELIIKLSNEKKSSYEIADILGISQTKASFWIRRYRNTGSLEDKLRSGRPTKLTKEKLKSITKLIRANMIKPINKKQGITSKELLDIIQRKVNNRYTLRHAQRLLHKMGFSLITPRISHIRKDENAQERFRAEFKKNSNRNMWVIQ